MYPMPNMPFRSPLDLLASMRSGSPHPHHSAHSHLAQWEEWANGSSEIPDCVKAVILFVLKENTDHIMAGHGYVPEAGATQHQHSERHRRFKEVMEELRDAPSLEVDKLISSHFHNLTAEEHRVIKNRAQDRSKRKIAELTGVGTVERLKEIELSAEAKLNP